MIDTPVIRELIEALRCLPGVGPKSAQRMAYHLLEHGRPEARRLSQALAAAVEKVGRCQMCRTLSEESLCSVCGNAQRDPSQICVVETPADVYAVEQSAMYRGRYFVLLGRLSPLDGIGPEQLGLDLLERRLEQDEVKEVILATNATVEGEATAYYIAEMARARGIRTTRLAQGVPLGGELEYIDGGTLAHALVGRRDF